ncbi:hypothetical protein BGZ83_001303 [Gryganskiella cystojenkinii]|nr:hypothetical protein BGZ83_001303 [Gryganskiella cystojenkinii]
MNPTNERDQSASQHRHPPVLSFRAFHASHFTPQHRQAFFAGYPQGPFHPSWHHPPPPPMWSSSGEWFAPQATDLQAQAREHEQHVVPFWRQGEEEQSIERPVEGSGYEDDTDLNQYQEESGGDILSEETIAIFEFSRRFREEKAAAALLEKTRLKLRRTKRRKLTSLGFALNEGNSDESDDLSHQGESEDEQEGKEENEDDDDTPVAELPATDTTFMNVNDKQRERTQQRLYGLGTDRVKSSGVRNLEILEDLLNQTYDDSLAPDGVVYWPNMPLRC